MRFMICRAKSTWYTKRNSSKWISRTGKEIRWRMISKIDKWNNAQNIQQYRIENNIQNKELADLGLLIFFN